MSISSQFIGKTRSVENQNTSPSCSLEWIDISNLSTMHIRICKWKGEEFLFVLASVCRSASVCNSSEMAEMNTTESSLLNRLSKENYLHCYPPFTHPTRIILYVIQIHKKCIFQWSSPWSDILESVLSQEVTSQGMSEKAWLRGNLWGNTCPLFYARLHQTIAWWNVWSFTDLPNSIMLELPSQ